MEEATHYLFYDDEKRAEKNVKFPSILANVKFVYF